VDTLAYQATPRPKQAPDTQEDTRAKLCASRRYVVAVAACSSASVSTIALRVGDRLPGVIRSGNANVQKPTTRA
jgi:hypothetical protein